MQKGLDKVASYTASELIVYPEILYNKPTAQVPVPIETAMSSKIIGEKGPVRSVANAIRLQEHGWVDLNRPVALLFLSISGVGKMGVAKQGRTDE